MSDDYGRRGTGDPARASGSRRQFSTPSAAATRTAPAPAARRGPRPLIVIVCALLAVLIVAAGVIFWLRRPTGPSRPTLYAVANTFVADPIACPAQAAWAPDSTRLAIVGFSKCPGANQAYPGAGDVSAATLT